MRVGVGGVVGVGGCGAVVVGRATRAAARTLWRRAPSACLVQASRAPTAACPLRCAVLQARPRCARGADLGCLA